MKQSGERRYRASLKAELRSIPCIIEKLDPEKRLAIQLMENIQREDQEDRGGTEGSSFIETLASQAVHEVSRTNAKKDR